MIMQTYQPGDRASFALHRDTRKGRNRPAIKRSVTITSVVVHAKAHSRYTCTVDGSTIPEWSLTVTHTGMVTLSATYEHGGRYAMSQHGRWIRYINRRRPWLQPGQ